MNNTLKQANKILGTKYRTWENLSCYGHLSESFTEQFQDKVRWGYISVQQKLSESFIEKFQDKVRWECVSVYQKLSEAFIEQFQIKVEWNCISKYQPLSPLFIQQFQDKVNWNFISKYQKLSETFIEQFQDKVNWNFISKYQKLSETFIEQFQDKVNWEHINVYQKLSESFIEQFQNKLNWEYIGKYQKLSEAFLTKHDLTVPENCWLYKSLEFKKEQILQTKKYILEDDYIIAYKGIRSDNYSTFQYQYFVGEAYSSHCDCNVDNKNSFGLSAWTLEDAKNYCDQKIIKVKIHLNDLGCIVHDSYKLRCFKFTVVEEIKEICKK